MAFLKHENKINRKRPTIGVTGPDKGGETAWLFTAFSVWLAGGWPIRITPSRHRTADGLQGLIIGGGADVDPNTYEKEHVLNDYLKNKIKSPGTSFFQRIRSSLRWLYYPALYFIRKLFSRKLIFGLDMARDHLEFQLLDQAVKKKLPVIGICRGAQLMNVYFRGSLHKDISSFYTEAPNPASTLPVKKVNIKAGSKLRNVLGTDVLLVNALHNQAVHNPGSGLEIVAQEANGVVQGIEHTSHEFLIGIQWHPEYLPQSPTHQKLFKALVQKAREVNQQIEEPDMEAALAEPMAPEIIALEEEAIKK